MAWNGDSGVWKEKKKQEARSKEAEGRGMKSVNQLAGEPVCLLFRRTLDVGCRTKE